MLIMNFLKGKKESSEAYQKSAADNKIIVRKVTTKESDNNHKKR